jgi:arylsulfatase A-like enzyme
LYQGKEPTLRPNVTDRQVWYRHPEWSADYGLRTFVERYCGEVSHLDSAFGRILDKVETLGLANSTTVVLTSDHGEMAGSHGIYGKGVMYEEAMQIPLIVQHPAGPTGKRSDVLFSSVDFYPTLLDLCGLEPAPSAEGMNYGPLIRGEEQGRRDAVFAQYKNLCIRSSTHKLVADATARAPFALYDLESDPYEQSNLVDHPECAHILQEMQNRLIAWLADVGSRAGDADQASLTSPAFARRM